MADDVKELFEALRRESSAAHEETRRHFDLTAEKIRGEVATVAEAVLSTTRQIERVAADVKHDFNETQAMIKFSHAELDRRVRALEDDVAELQSRVARLELPPAQ